MWVGASVRYLKASWTKLWPDADPPNDFERFDDQNSAAQEIVTVGNSMVLEMDVGDVDEVVEGQHRAHH